MHRFALMIIKFCFAVSPLQGQASIFNASDCQGAIPWTKNVLDSVQIPNGFGAIKDIWGNNINSEHYFTREHHTLWLKFKMPNDGAFEFQITPEVAEDDFDFLIFKSDSTKTCERIVTKEISPIRSNISRKNPATGGMTGLKQGYSNNYAKAGAGPLFSNPLQAKKNEEYYLVIDAPYGAKGGFSVLSSNIEGEKEAPIKDTVMVPPIVVKPRLQVRVFDLSSNELLSGIDIRAKGIAKGDSLTTRDDGTIDAGTLQKYQRFEFDFFKAGYKHTSLNYLHRTEVDTTLDVWIEPLKVGSTLAFEDIVFVANTAHLMPESNKHLSELTKFMQTNEGIEVEIGGHVNAVGRIFALKKRKLYRLSEDRAKAVYYHLIEQGINPLRLSFKGYGNSKMVYLNPIDEKQSKANRRVEIKVTQINGSNTTN